MVFIDPLLCEYWPFQMYNHIAAFLLEFLFANISCPSFVASAIAQLYALLLKLSWFDLDEQQLNVHGNMAAFFQVRKYCWE